ncbi:GPI anchored dioxygenase [Penicillium cataractarum]|uniref:GPI anchored dioxygenase n=1 Tax=Penicillium cataractarum TaxID=2100454 RepID=A0A9W9SMT6_9EURO|nr:GPI anchored dioxygenase [Penicillium cataractarum]KAJ5381367.1 GPI anchored dioxygenase [Penicillium cataractarum]
MLSLCLLLLLHLSGFGTAHPGSHDETAYFRSLVSSRSVHEARQKLARCSDHIKRKGLDARAATRRAAILDSYRGISHSGAGPKSSRSSTSQAVLSSSENPPCLLTPEATIGPFWVDGELIRSNVTDGEPGIPLILDGEFIDIHTCEPVEDVFWEIWNCNATGTYSGVQDFGHHHGDDDSNLDKTYLRGVQRTDKDGAAQFTTVFPGHYPGRATHIHVLAHVGATILPNNTVTGGHVAHIGQLFFDQDLIAAVESTPHYKANNVRITPNINDGIFNDVNSASGYDPILSYTRLGHSLDDGILAWTTMGIDLSASYEAESAASLTDHGGVAHFHGWSAHVPGAREIIVLVVGLGLVFWLARSFRQFCARSA